MVFGPSERCWPSHSGKSRGANGQTLVRRAKTLASASLSQAVGLLTLGASVRYTGARPDLASKPELPSYVLLDLTARYPLARDWTLFGRVENVTDEKYQMVAGYNTPGRGAFAGFRARF